MMATQLPALLRTNMGPPPPTPVERAAGKVEKYGTQIAGKLEEQGAFEAEKAAQKAEQLSQQAKQRAEAMGTERKAIEESAPFQDLQRVEKEAAQARFEPTQRSIQENAALFSLIGVIGFAIGAGGKQNAMQAMSGLNGMLKGVQEGDMDRYKQEKTTFDTNLKALAQKSNLLTAQLKRITELAARDKEKANLELDSLLAQQQADFVKQYKDKYGLPATIKYLEQKQKGAQQMLTLAQRAEDQAMQRARDQEFQRQQQQERLAFQQALQTQRIGAQQAMLDQRMAAAEEKAKNATKEDKPPAKEVVALNNARNVLIPALDQGLKVLERINKQGDWELLTTTFGINPRLAEIAFKDDKEALELIRTFSKFRAGEFETAGKALTKTENKILAPLYQADFRVYEGIKNAMEQGLKTLKTEQRGMEAAYPFVRKYNQTIRGELGLPEGAPSGAASKTMPTGDKLKAYADTHFGGNEEQARQYLSSQGYQ